MKRFLTVFFCCLAITNASLSAQGDAVPGLSEAVAFYHENATSDFPTMLEATHQFEAVAAAHDQAWLPAYWTAFVYTQLSLFSRDERQAAYVELARRYYDKAGALLPEGRRDNTRAADFHALNAMVYSFQSRTVPDSAATYERMMNEAWERSRAADPDNPMLWMHDALDLIVAESTRNRAHDLAGQAITRYRPRMGTVYPNWGREFLDVWMRNYPRVP